MTRREEDGEKRRERSPHAAMNPQYIIDLYTAGAKQAPKKVTEIKT